MRVLLDTHTALWLAASDDRLPAGVTALMQDPATRPILSIASTWEMTIKVLAGRLHLPQEPPEYIDSLVRDFRFDTLPIEQRHVDALCELPHIHRDPFDRILIAQALADDLELVTGDQRLRAYPIKTIW